MKQPSLTYRAAFLCGGVAFAVLSYALGTWIYDAELHFWDQRDMVDGLWALLARVPTEHPLTFFPWVAGVTTLAILLGYLFDRQVQLRTRLEAMAVTDGLTLIYNRRYFMQQLSTEIKRTQRTAHRFALLLLDIDDFKEFNDRRGHLAGDDALRLVAQAIRSCVRDTDVVARYGGEEFVVIATGTDRGHGALLAERIRARIEQVSPVTVSIGVAGFPKDGISTEELISAADAAMYAAKSSAKNRVQVSEKLLGLGSLVAAEASDGAGDLCQCTPRTGGQPVSDLG